jgi:uncharacterized membrane protein
VAKTVTSAKSPASKSPAPKGKPTVGGRPPGLFTWVAIGVVIVIVLGLVIIKVTKNSPTSTNSGTYVPTSAATLADLTTIPASVFNTVGVSSSAFQVTAPLQIKNQPALTATAANGKTLPEVLYIGAEYCPFCAAQRWSTIVALSRFGTWKGLGDTASSSTDQYPNTPTFTFRKATFTSPYLVFTGVEQFSNVTDPSNAFYYPLMTTTKAQTAVIDKYDVSKYFGAGVGSGSIPFLSLGNQFFVAGASYLPSMLTGETRDQIAANLKAPTSPITDAIIASANFQTAAMCKITNEQPSSVCNSSGVKAAKTALKI